MLGTKHNPICTCSICHPEMYPETDDWPIDPDSEWGFKLLNRMREGDSIKAIHDSYAAMREAGDPNPTIPQLVALAKHLEDEEPQPVRMADGITTNGRGGFATGRPKARVGSSDASPQPPTKGTGTIMHEEF